MFESTGSLLEGSMPGRADRAGDEARLVGRRVLVARRAREPRGADVDLARPCRSSPHSSSRRGVDWNVHVSTTSQPTARNDSWIAWMTSGRVSTRLSLHPSSDLPPKSSAREVVALDVRPHRAVVDEHAAASASR